VKDWYVERQKSRKTEKKESEADVFSLVDISKNNDSVTDIRAP
jgi:hypothetical protein